MSEEIVSHDVPHGDVKPVKVFKDTTGFAADVMPDVLHAPGLTAQRKEQLYKDIRQFISDPLTQNRIYPQ